MAEGGNISLEEMRWYKTSTRKPVMVTHAFTISTEEAEDSLVSVVSSRPARATTETLSKKNINKNQ